MRPPNRAPLNRHILIWSRSMTAAITMPQGTFEIHSEPHGPHWIAWFSRAGSSTPERGVILVGQTRAEAETRARAWVERQVSENRAVTE